MLMFANEGGWLPFDVDLGIPDVCCRGCRCIACKACLAVQDEIDPPTLLANSVPATRSAWSRMLSIVFDAATPAIPG